MAGPALAQRRAAVFLPTVGSLYPRQPLELVRGEGVHVWDADGRRYLDFLCGVAVTSLGHCHPEVVEAAAGQLGRLQHTTSLFLSEPAVVLAERLLAVAPPGISRVFFCADGSGAVEGALLAARIATGRRGFLSFDVALHGRTSLAMSVTGLPMWRCDPFPPEGMAKVAFPQDGDAEGALARVRQAVESAPRDSFAAFILEPIPGNGGVLVPPDGFLEGLAEYLQGQGILLVVDEVQCGLCRTGRWFGVDHHGISPDIVCVAKALANGLPQGAWMCTERVASAIRTPLASTFGGNQVAMAAGARVLEIMAREDLCARAAALGDEFLARLGALGARHRAIGPPRGRGLMIGVPTRGADTLDAILDGLRRRGVIAGRSGARRDVLTILPPLIATAGHVDEFCAALGDVLGELPPC